MNDDGTSESGGRSTERLLALIGEHRDSIREELDDEEYALLLTRLEALATSAADDDKAVRRALQGVRLALLPLPFDHPVRVFALDAVRLVATPPGPATVPGARDLLAWLTAPAPEPEPAHPTASGRGHLLLGAPALSAEEARTRCGGPPPPELIRVPDPQDGERYPEFQFAEDNGTPRNAVLEVNRLLLAAVDPWGAGAWWLSENTWLGGIPASLLGRLPDHRLVGAATELVEGE
ncbi:hypothetical protein [Streptomyces sp. NPDC088246]|uniref:hypothetical protein n=1 Tax=Streptomyces sp. NPDC088246 TaxID=3365842 RepID=UPI0038221C70